MFVSDVHSKQDKQQGKWMMGNERKRGKLDNLHFGKQAFLMKQPLFEQGGISTGTGKKWRESLIGIQF